MAIAWSPDGENDSKNTPVRGGGFWVTHPQIKLEDDRGEPINGANAYLENAKAERIGLWINSVQADFAATGSTAQSRTGRDFYHHNFQQPTMILGGQTPNSAEYNRLGAFIRDSHKLGLTHQGQVLRLRVDKGGKNTVRGNMRGQRNHIDVDGYILNATRGAERFVNAPDYEFSFVITKAREFLDLQDRDADPIKLMTIMGILRSADVPFVWEDGEVPKYGTGGDGGDSGGNGNGGNGDGGGHPGAHHEEGT